MNRKIPLSVIVCTYNRSGYLKLVLDSLTRQTVSKNDYEIIIIDDGSSDDTRNLVQNFKPLLPLTYFYQKNSGLAAAKNHGIFASGGEIVLFLDDDDIAMPTLLEEHIKTHRKYSEQHMAVLHYTTWAQDLVITPLMNFITEVGCFLFSYPHIKHGDILDYTYFWGGRSSCKRGFLLENGVFNPVFRFGCEDIELGYRLSKYGLKVVYNGKAASKMVRAVTFDDFCMRLIRQGRSQYVFSILHDDPEVKRWTEVIEAEELWNDIAAVFKAKVNSARELDRIASLKQKYPFVFDDLTKILVYKAYWWVFKACKIKGIMEAKEDAREKPSADQAVYCGLQADNAPYENSSDHL
ncbi:MAG: glycosyltransferase family A protein [Thermodesulfovibrionales bacterium]|jgi:glycosyltransferase involved in cell wall biosynthesis